MKKALGVFFPLYTTTMIMLLGAGLLTTYISLRLASANVNGVLIGAIIAANYIGLVLGGKVGYFLIGRVGHIRTYVSCAGIITAAVLLHGVTEFIPIWVGLRLIIGLCLMCQYMVLESWFNDQAAPNQRGVVFGFYMAASYLGMALGQLVLMVQPDLGIQSLLIIAICFSLCLVPIALTTRSHAQQISPAPMELRFFINSIPKILASTLVIGMLVGSFYGLAPVYASLQSLSTQQTGLFMATSIFAGLVAQLPFSWLSDRYNRLVLLRIIALMLVVAALPLAILPHISFYLLLGIGFLVGMLQFTLYPLVVALANDQIEPERRVSLAACLLMSFGVGASIGPLIVGALMEPLGGNILYAFFILCGLITVLLSRTTKRQETHFVEDAPLPHIAMPDSLMSSPLSPALNPSFDEQMIQESMPAPEPATDEQETTDSHENPREQTGEETETAVIIIREPGEHESEDGTEGGHDDRDKGLEKAYTMV
ncbi:MFS transporter [Pragia fontium]|uniref:Major Facilitator Superfamily protein n=2 Tax=Pragia fontium TaxID=82985 RepID=A0AAJ4WDD6_9GAMM|nr:MFS transporter [Pragia fontium]AKJ40742.1 MFS transporter [Pragia fontium]GKX63692.1 MFS transporter [Pragia fontium]SFD40120.1 Major Facilitator Superfamily protein [Pragia fontium DSM 5563 = ATCC 49100]